MRTVVSRTICWAAMFFSCAIFLAAAIGMLAHREPFTSWFYCFAWWSYILFMEAFLYHRGGYSMLFTSPRRFLELLPLSLNVWLIFEIFNFRLHNWSYLDVPSSLTIRWLGYVISYATVLPGIFTTWRLLHYLGLFQGQRVKPLLLPQHCHAILAWLGLAQLVLPLIWPRYFFPLVWGGFIFLLEPVNHKLQGKSLLRDWETGSLQRFCQLLCAGACCGLLWEFWNFWAGAKWVYTIPLVHGLKIFEMPLLGFLGFPPFAVECYVMVESFALLGGKLDERYDPARVRLIRGALAILVTLVDGAVFAGIDHFTVVSYRAY
jgi:hypothetical protein